MNQFYQYIIILKLMPETMAHICNPSSWEAEAEQPQVYISKGYPYVKKQ